jgi:hypothetical protein
MFRISELMQWNVQLRLNRPEVDVPHHRHSFPDLLRIYLGDRALLRVRAPDELFPGTHVGSVRVGSDVLPATALRLRQQQLVPVVLRRHTCNVSSPGVFQKHQFLRLHRHRHEPTSSSPGRTWRIRTRMANDVVSQHPVVLNGYLLPRIHAGVSDALDQLAKRGMSLQWPGILYLPRQSVVSLMLADPQCYLFHTNTGGCRFSVQIPQQGFHLWLRTSSVARFLTNALPIWNVHHAQFRRMGGIAEDHSV